jgi:hypothetical protein
MLKHDLPVGIPFANVFFEVEILGVCVSMVTEMGPH